MATVHQLTLSFTQSYIKCFTWAKSTSINQKMSVVEVKVNFLLLTKPHCGFCIVKTHILGSHIILNINFKGFFRTLQTQIPQIQGLSTLYLHTFTRHERHLWSATWMWALIHQTCRKCRGVQVKVARNINKKVKVQYKYVKIKHEYLYFITWQHWSYVHLHLHL